MDDIERGLILRGERFDINRGDKVTVTGIVRVIVNPASVVNRDRISQWMEER